MTKKKHTTEMAAKIEAAISSWNRLIAAFCDSEQPTPKIDAKAMVDAGFDANSGKPKIYQRPSPGTAEYGRWISSAEREASQRFSIVTERFKWMCAFEQALNKLAGGEEK